METMLEKEKRLPILIIGHPPASLASFARISGVHEAPLEKANFYFLLCLGEEELKNTLDELIHTGARPEQIILMLPENFTLRFAHDPLVGALEIAEDDSAEDTKFRLMARVESQRHRKLSAEIETARAKGLPSELTAEEWFTRMEAAHLTHGFACAFELPGGRHSEAIRYALAGQTLSQETWETNASLESLLPACALLALKHWQSPAKFREELRRLSALLPFRTRTDIRSVAERCLESIWKGITNVA